MADIIQFKPNTKNIKRNVSRKCQIIEFPNVNEYIEIYEKILNKRKDKKSIYNAFLQINKIVSKLDKPSEKRIQICNFVDYFVDSINDSFLSEMRSTLDDDKQEIFFVYEKFIEDDIIDEGYNLLRNIDKDFIDTLEKISSYICFDMKNERLIEFFSADNRFQYQIDLNQGSLELLTERKANILLALFARSSYSGGVFFIHEWKNNKDYVSGLIVNDEGIFSIGKKDLKNNVKGNRNVVYTELNLQDVLF